MGRKFMLWMTVSAPSFYSQLSVSSNERLCLVSTASNYRRQNGDKFWHTVLVLFHVFFRVPLFYAFLLSFKLRMSLKCLLHLIGMWTAYNVRINKSKFYLYT